ncbi:MAG TPA: MarR family transcriptional regulator [Candidatus Binataceae bacterium]|nr:MarR family transcriptional regulator [Candidatus Binataceae bacterium]
MLPKPSKPSTHLSRAAQTIEHDDQPFTDAARALVKAGFLFTNHPDRRYQAYDLTLTQVDVLSVLARAKGASISCSEIADRTLITKGGITGILDRLEARGLVKRIPSSDDRRSVLIRLSAKGVELFRKLNRELVRGNKSLLEKAFRPEQMKEFTKLLELLIRGLETK